MKTYDDLITPIFVDFANHYRNFMLHGYAEKSAMAKAFSEALRENIEILSSDVHLHPMDLDRGGKDFLRHAEKQRGYEIGEAINENPSCYSLENRDELMGRMLRKQVFVLKVGK